MVSTASYTIQLNSLAYVIYTSVYTGTPKGMMVEHRALALHLHAILQHYHPTIEDKILQLANLNFDIALEQLFTAWLSGGRLLFLKNNLLPPSELLSLLQKQAITIADIPPAYWQELLSLNTNHKTLPALRLLILGSEAVPYSLAVETRVRFPKLRIINAYGPTETVITPTLYELPDSLQEPAGPYVSIGRCHWALRGNYVLQGKV